MDKKQIVVSVVVLVVGGALGFFGGIKYQQSKTALARTQAGSRFAGGPGGGAFFAQTGQGGQGRRVGGANGGFAAGEVLSKDDKSVTIKMQDGGSKIVFYSPSTQISKPEPVQVSDLSVGENVVVAGSQNSDGSVTAQTIQIRPAMPNSPSPTPSK